MALVATFSPYRAHAADGTWNPTGFTGDGTGLWSDTTKWTGGTVANGAGFQANFSTLNITTNSIVSLDSARTLGRLQFGDATTVSNSWTLDNNGNVANILTLDDTGGSGGPKITVNNQTTTISAILAGTNGVTLTGGTGTTQSATLALSGANTYSGVTTINSAGQPNNQQFSVLLQNNAALGTSSMFFDPGGTFGARISLDSGVTIPNSITVHTARAIAGNAALRVNGIFTATFDGPITFDSGATASSGGHFGGPAEAAFNPTGNFLIFTKAINASSMVSTAKNLAGGSGNRLQVRHGQVKFSGTGSTYFGLELRSGAIQIGATNALSTSSYIDIGGNSEGNPQNYAVVDLNGFNQSLMGLSNYVGTLSDIRPATVTNSSTTSASTLTLTPADPTSNPNQANLVLQSSATGGGAALVQLTNQSTNAPLNLAINGAAAGTQYMITPRSGYTGTTTLTSGTLAISSLADGGVTANLTTTAGSTTATVDTTAGLAVGQLIVGDGVRTTGFNGAGGGPTAISAIDTGTNTVTLNNLATTSGTFLSAFGTANTLGISTSAASNLVFNGGTLRYTNTSLNATNGNINLTNSTSPSTNRNFTINNGSSGTLEVTSAGTTLTMSGGSAATTGSLVKTGAGTLVLTGTNQHTGGTTVSAGTVLVNGTGSLSTGTVSVLSGATLGGNGTIGGTVNVASGGIFAPGASVGTLTVGGLTLNSGSFANFEFDGVNNDLITVSNAGGLTINAGNLNLYNVGGITPYSTNGTYTLMNINGGFTGSLSSLTVANAVAGKFYNLTNSPATGIQLTIGNATTADWNGSTSTSWTTGANWIGGSSPNAVGTTVRFNGTNLSGSANTTVSVDGGGKTASGVIVNDDSSGTSFDITGPGTLTLNNGVAAAAINVSNGSHTISAPISSTNSLSISMANGSSLTDSGGISGGKPLSLTGTGTLTLTVANSHSSTTLTAATSNSATLNVGTFGGSDTTGTLGSGNLTISGGAVLNFNRSNAYSFGGGITGAGVGAGSVNQLGTGTTTVTGAISNVTTVNVSAGGLTASSTIDQTGGTNVTGSGSLTANGGISGAGALSVNTSGTVALNTGNNYTGGTSITGGTVNLNAAGALPTNSALGVDGGTLNLNANNISVTSFLDTIAGGMIVNNGAAASTSTITFNGAASSDDIFAAVNNGAGGGKVALVTSISNTQSGNIFVLHLHSAGTYSGGTVVNSQSIQADASDAFGSGPITVSQNNASTNSSQILLAPGVSISNNITIAQGYPLPVNGVGTFGVIQQTAAGGDTHVYGTVTIQANNFNGGLFNGPAVGGSDYLNVHGAVNTSGTANTIIQRSGQVRYYGGGNYPNIAVNGLGQLGANNGLNQSAVVQIAALENGTFDLGGFDQTAVALSATSANTATVQNSGAGFNTLTLNTSGSNTFNGTIDGNIHLTVGGTGTQILSGANTYAGDTRAQGGTLSISNAYLADAADVYVSTGALFDLNFAGNDIIDSLFLGGTPAAVGTWGGAGSGATNISALLSGTGILDVQTLGTLPGVPGDYNNNGVVDAADYILWRKGGPLQNDPTPGVQPADYTFWRSRFGATTPGSGSMVAGGSVPEPSTAMLFASIMIMLAVKQRSHSSRL